MKVALVDVSDLPADSRARGEELEHRAEQNKNRPRLSAVREADLASVEERNAQCYVSAEETTYRFLRLAKRLRNGIKKDD